MSKLLNNEEITLLRKIVFSPIETSNVVSVMKRAWEKFQPGSDSDWHWHNHCNQNSWDNLPGWNRYAAYSRS